MTLPLQVTGKERSLFTANVIGKSDETTVKELEVLFSSLGKCATFTRSMDTVFKLSLTLIVKSLSFRCTTSYGPEYLG